MMPEQTLWDVLSRFDELSMKLGRPLQHGLGGPIMRDDLLGPPQVSSEKPAAQAMKSLDAGLGPTLAKRLDDRMLERYLEPLRVFIEQHNWFPDPTMSLAVFQLATADDIVEQLERYVSARLSQHHEFLLEFHPERRLQVDAAFETHHRGEYLVSVPLLLIIADGIAHGAVGGSLFMKTGREKMKDRADKSSREEKFRHVLLRPLSADIPLVKNEKQRREDPPAAYLNRHTVLHGEALDYGTKQNSLRAFSFCYYVAFVLSATSASTGLKMTEYIP